MKARTGSFIGLASSNELRIALHYEDAARILYKSEAYQDGLALPFLFLVRQFLELGLKYNIKKLDRISSSNRLVARLNRVHNLNEIHQAFLEHYQNIKSSNNAANLSDQKGLDALDRLVSKISLLDSGSQGYRYSENTSGEKIIDQKEIFNLKEVFELLEDSSDFLSVIEDVFGLVYQ